MKRGQYIGVTGFMTSEEVKDVMSVIPKDTDILFMVGVLTSFKRIDTGENNWPNSFPEPKKIRSIFPADERALNLIHYSCGHTSRFLDEEVDRIVEEFGGPNLDGFQFNQEHWPSTSRLSRIKNSYPELRIVLQTGKGFILDDPDSPKALVECFREMYPNGEVDDLILDLSRGLGKPMNVDLILRHVDAIYSADLGIGVTVAGGRDSTNVHEIRPILRNYPVSWDTQHNVRNDDDTLNLDKTKSYTIESYKLGDRT